VYLFFKFSLFYNRKIQFDVQAFMNDWNSQEHMYGLSFKFHFMSVDSLHPLLF
jgi:hypothetical protein